MIDADKALAAIDGYIYDADRMKVEFRDKLTAAECELCDNAEAIRFALRLTKLATSELEDRFWDGLPRAMVMSRDLHCYTMGELKNHLANSGVEIPEALFSEFGAKDGAHLAKGDVAVIIFKAIINKMVTELLNKEQADA